MTKSITVGNKDFKSKKEAKEYFDGIVKSYQVGDTINNPIHHELLLNSSDSFFNLLCRNNEARNKQKRI